MHSHTANAALGDVWILLAICAKFCNGYGPFDESLEEKCKVGLVGEMSGGIHSGQSHII